MAIIDIVLTLPPFVPHREPWPVVVRRTTGNGGSVAVRVPWTIDPMARWCVRAVHDQSIARVEPAALTSLPLPCPAPFSAPRAHDLGRPQSRETIAERLISPPAKAGSSRSLRFK